ncbi:MAG: sulfoxide reductase heme-binding subunit YedZ [Gammaproteobacteria bacterium]|nr:sulfoxide reductase heme-binding subunit YedZ [Gammaproteobacteria bacterium]
MALPAALKSAYAKPIVHLLCLLPFGALVWAVFNDGLGANPVEKLTHETGDWTLRFLLITLALTPLRQWTGQAAVIRFRRMLGLYTFFYVSCHFLIWFVADHSLDPGGMIEDIVKRPYITLGFSAFVLMTPLAITSSQAMIRRLGRKWKTLHQLVYLIIVLGVLHFLWLVKADYLEPAIYAIIAIILLAHRLGPIRRLGIKSSPVRRQV